MLRSASRRPSGPRPPSSREARAAALGNARHPKGTDTAWIAPISSVFNPIPDPHSRERMHLRESPQNEDVPDAPHQGDRARHAADPPARNQYCIPHQRGRGQMQGTRSACPEVRVESQNRTRRVVRRTRIKAVASCMHTPAPQHRAPILVREREPFRVRRSRNRIRLEKERHGWRLSLPASTRPTGRRGGAQKIRFPTQTCSGRTLKQRRVSRTGVAMRSGSGSRSQEFSSPRGWGLEAGCHLIRGSFTAPGAASR